MPLQNIDSNIINKNQDEVTFKELIQSFQKWIDFLKNKSKIIFIISILSGFIGLAYSYIEKPKYKALLTFAMDEDKGANGSGINSAMGLASSFGIDLNGNGGGAFAASNLTELMKSRLIIEKALLCKVNINSVNTTLADYFFKKNYLKFNSKVLNNLKDIDFSDQKMISKEDSVLHLIYNYLISSDQIRIIQKDKKVSILSIEVISHDEIFAKLFCESLAKETSSFYILTKSKKAKLNVEVLQRQVDSIKKELNSSIMGVATEVDNVYNLNPALNVKATSSKKKQLDVQSNTTILTNLTIQLELAKINLRKETPLIQVIDTPFFPLKNENFGKITKCLIFFSIGLLLSTLVLSIIRIYKRALI